MKPTLCVAVEVATLARHGLDASDVLDAIETIGGKPVGEIVEGNRRFTMQVRVPLEQRGRADAISNLRIGDNEGYFIPLAQLADIQDEGHGLPNTSDSYFAAGNTNIGFTPTCGSMIISFWFGLRQEMCVRH